jgi:hypothetical protein
MADELVPCLNCGQHHRVQETVCPHCKTAVSPLSPEERARRAFLKAAVATGATVAAGALALASGAAAQYRNAVPPYSVAAPIEQKIASPVPALNPLEHPFFRRYRQLNEALAFHSAGNFAEADRLYRILLGEAPDFRQILDLVDLAKAKRVPLSPLVAEEKPSGLVPEDLVVLVWRACEQHTARNFTEAIALYNEVLIRITKLRELAKKAQAHQPPN